MHLSSIAQGVFCALCLILLCAGILAALLTAVHRASRPHLLSYLIPGILCFTLLPEQLMRLFSKSEEVIAIGRAAFPIIGSSFLAAVFSLMTPVFFQAIGNGLASLMLSLTRQIFVLVPVFWACSKISLNSTWIAFPVAELIAGALGMMLYVRQLSLWHLPLDVRRKPAKTR